MVPIAGAVTFLLEYKMDLYMVITRLLKMEKKDDCYIYIYIYKFHVYTLWYSPGQKVIE